MMAETAKLDLESSLEHKRKWLADAFQQRSSHKGNQDIMLTEIDKKQKWLENANKKHSPGKRAKSVTEKDIVASIGYQRSMSVTGLDFVKIEHKWIEAELLKKKHINRELEIHHDKQTKEVAALEFESILNESSTLGITEPIVDRKSLDQPVTQAYDTAMLVPSNDDFTNAGLTEKQLETSIYFAGDVTEAQCELTPAKENKIVEQLHLRPNNMDLNCNAVESASKVETIIYFAGDVKEAECEQTPLPSNQIRQEESLLNEYDELQSNNDPTSKNLEKELYSAGIGVENVQSKLYATSSMNGQVDKELYSAGIAVEMLTTKYMPSASERTCLVDDRGNKLDDQVDSELDVKTDMLQTKCDEMDCAINNYPSDTLKSATPLEGELHHSNKCARTTDSKATQPELECLASGELPVSKSPESGNEVASDREARATSMQEANKAKTALATVQVPENKSTTESASNVDVEIDTTVCHGGFEIQTLDVGTTGSVEMQLVTNDQSLPEKPTADIVTPFKSDSIAKILHRSNQDLFGDSNPLGIHLLEETNRSSTPHLEIDSAVDELASNTADLKSENDLASVKLVTGTEIEDLNVENVNSAIVIDENANSCQREPQVSMMGLLPSNVLDLPGDQKESIATQINLNEDAGSKAIEQSINDHGDVDQHIVSGSMKPLDSFDGATCAVENPTIGKSCSDGGETDIARNDFATQPNDVKLDGDKVDINSSHVQINKSENSQSHMIDQIVVLSQSSEADDLIYVTDLRVDDEHLPGKTTEGCRIDASDNQDVKSLDKEKSRELVNDLAESKLLRVARNDGMDAVSSTEPTPAQQSDIEAIAQDGCDDFAPTIEGQIPAQLENSGDGGNSKAKDGGHSASTLNSKPVSGFLFRVKIQEASISEGSQSPAKFNLAKAKSNDNAEPGLLEDCEVKPEVSEEPTVQSTHSAARNEQENSEPQKETDDSSPSPALAIGTTSTELLVSAYDVASPPTVNATVTAEAIEQTVSTSSPVKQTEPTTDAGRAPIKVVDNDQIPQEWCLQLRSTQSLIDGLKAELAASSSSLDNEDIPGEEFQKPGLVNDKEPDVSVGVHCLESCSIM